MSRALTTAQFVEKAEAIHGDFYSYDKVVYVKNSVLVTIVCPNHGEFTQTPQAHLKAQGCPTCGKEKRAASISKRFDTKHFVDKSKEIHGDRYNYDKVIYTKNNELVTIGCEVHGCFEQQPRIHVLGSGCPHCAQADNNYWSYSMWKQAGEKSAFFDSYKVYVIKCYNEDEQFYKIGKTYNTVAKRFSRGQLPYEYEVITTIEGSARHICELEQRLLNEHTEHRYTPKVLFAGSGECFKEIDLSERV
jgi:hypothetical protein